MDAFELLKNDHKKVSQLFEEIESASGQTKTQLFSSLKKELDLHAHVEETVFYPALENTEAAREITLEAYEEHKVVKALLSELGSGGAPNDEWDAKFTVLKENVEHHVEEEEGELFSKARQALTKEQIERFGVEMEAEKSRKQGGAPRPSTPEAARRDSQSASQKDSQSASQKNESPGVLQRIASLVGLGDKSASGSKNAGKKRGTATTKRATPKKASAKRSSSKQAKKSAAKKSGTKKLGAQRSTTKKSTAKKSAVKESAGKTRSAGTAKRASKAGRSKSTKRQASVGARSSARKAARPAATKKAGRGATKRRRAK